MTTPTSLFNNALLLTLAAVIVAPAAFAALTVEDVYPEQQDPFAGNWKGRWCDKEKVNPDIAAQVIPRRGERYEIRLVSKLFMRCPPLLITQAEAENGVLAFNDGGYEGEIRDGVFTGGRRIGDLTFEMKRYEHDCAALGAAPPEGAIVLFDGTNLDPWREPEGWDILDGGVMMVNPRGKTLNSKQGFKSCALHVEFRLPLMRKYAEQQRGNSGVFLQGTYEVQVLDSFGLEGYYNECGALYKVSAPRVNACLPPLAWQVYDIEYHAPVYNADGALEAYPHITVYHNGVLIQKDVEMRQITAWKEEARLADPPRDPGPIQLQAHNNFMQFRNVWLLPLDK